MALVRHRCDAVAVTNQAVYVSRMTQRDRSTTVSESPLLRFRRSLTRRNWAVIGAMTGFVVHAVGWGSWLVWSRPET